MNATQENELQTKKEYNSPELITFGDVRTLTQAGSGVALEAGSSSSNKKL